MSRLPVPATDRDANLHGYSRSRSGRKGSTPYGGRHELESESQRSQEGPPKITPTTTTTLAYRDNSERRNQGPSDRHTAERTLPSGLNRRRGDSPDPDPGQPSSGGTIGFYSGDLGPRSLEPTAAKSSDRHRPEGGSRPDPEPDQPRGPYGFNQRDEQPQNPRSGLDHRHRPEDPPRTANPELERSNERRPTGQHYTSQPDVTRTSGDRLSERPVDPPLARRSSPYHASSGTKKHSKDMYERHRRNG